MKHLLILLLTCCSALVYAQADSGIVVAAPSSDNTDDDVIFEVAQKAAEFPGGQKAWAIYLQKNLNANLALDCIKLKKKEKSASQTVYVKFLVDRDGSISDVGVVNESKVHPKLAEEAMRVIRIGPKWIPAVHKGKNVKYRAIQPITFMVLD